MGISFYRAATVSCTLSVALLASRALSADSRSQPAAAPTTAKGPHATEIARLIRDLGAPTYMARQHAQRMLTALGSEAQSALKAASEDRDHEVRQRARTALAAIADVDFHFRLGEFIDDRTGDDGHGLAGWERYRSLVGSDPAARQLFADMQRAEHELLEAVAERPTHAGSLLDARCVQLASGAQDGSTNRQAQYPLGTIAAMFFSASNPDVPVADRSVDCLNGFGQQNVLSQALQSQPAATLFRTLLDAWVGRPFERDARQWYNNLGLAMQFDLKGGLAPALAVIDPPPATDPRLEQFAVLAVGKLGGPEQVSPIEQLLDDERTIPDRGGRSSDVQMRDVALAVLVHLTRQNLSDYGFVHAKTNPFYLFNSNTLGFNDPAARLQALKKWRAWRATHEK